ncbi:MAG TPA: hypothetical protein VJJ20_03105 [Candidatus Paceibacterota bacterium]
MLTSFMLAVAYILFALAFMPLGACFVGIIVSNPERLSDSRMKVSTILAAACFLGAVAARYLAT